jgi:hypothetical protein
MDTYPSGNIRVSDADRDRAVAELSEHFQAGRITLAEFDERTDQALHAKTGSDLAVPFKDLPRIKRQAAAVPERLPATAAPPSNRVGALVAILVSACVAVGVSLLTVTEPHRHAVVILPIVLWILVIRRLVRVRGDGQPPR